MVFTNDLTIDADHRAPHDHAADETATLLGRRTNSSIKSSSRVSRFRYTGFLIAFVTLSSSAFVFLLNRGTTFPTEVGNIEAQVAKVQRPSYESPDILDVLSTPKQMTSSFEISETANHNRYYTYEDFSEGKSHKGGKGKGKPVFVVPYKYYKAQVLPPSGGGPTPLANLIINKAKELQATIILNKKGYPVFDAIDDVVLKLGCNQTDLQRQGSGKYGIDYCLIILFEGKPNSIHGGDKVLTVSKIDGGFGSSNKLTRKPIIDLDPSDPHGILAGSDAIEGEKYEYDSRRRVYLINSDGTPLSDGILKQPEVMKKSHNVEGYCPVDPTDPIAKKCTDAKDNVYVLTMEEGVHKSVIGKFHTRLFNKRLPGYTIKVKAGDNLRIQFKNKLEYQEGTVKCKVHELCTEKDCKVKNAYCEPDHTNIHLHGFWGSGEQPSDDIEMKIAPIGNPEKHATDYSLKSHFRKDHMPGTHWAHTHPHGASALQVGAGTAFALIVEDRPDFPIPPEVKHANDVILVVQHFNIPQTNSIADASFKENYNDKVFNFKVNPKHTPDGIDLFNDFRLVNGQYQPTLSITPGKWQRFRVIYAGWGLATSNSLNIKISNNAKGEECETNLLAKDGIYLKDYPRALKSFPIPAAGRADIMVRCNAAGKYNVTHFENEENLFTIVSEGHLHISDEPSVNFFEKVEFPNYLRNVRDKTPGKDCSCPTSLGFPNGVAAVNEVQYQPYKAVHTIKVGEIIERKLNGVAGHPYHQHVNPFQLTEGFRPTDEGYEGDLDRDGNLTDSTQGGYFKNGDWHDNIRCANKNNITVKYQPTRITGKMMLHCHRLNHEDTGMMSQERITVNGDCTCERDKMDHKEFQQYSAFISKQVRKDPTLH